MSRFPKEDDKNVIYLNYESWSEGGDLCEGEEDEPYASREPTYIEWSLTNCVLDKERCGFRREARVVDWDVKVGDELYVVFVRYQTGDTFGCTCGNWDILHVFKDEESAKALEKAVEDKTYKGEYGEYEGSIPWEGYFEHLESCEVKKMVVE